MTSVLLQYYGCDTSVVYLYLLLIFSMSFRCSSLLHFFFGISYSRAKYIITKHGYVHCFIKKAGSTFVIITVEKLVRFFIIFALL